MADKANTEPETVEEQPPAPAPPVKVVKGRQAHVVDA